ncbi:putative polyketide synthase [Heterostelium album PN500]|uniref:Putative polyketide synthase n=1 Tax=Heterostelium pallidum (strain ATCC 26659 / Pp 5 / PN500) TaxID=670386 RepID=D3BSJ8_HETP5|nr:putative polyketide synthase [Heterostelium album PN500]EFA75463.1 putative polyketide synthase [Heterostelium album PN500]|eukprot:XP_020427597.1 putative polyketide synthase [Heterostelium album PN500]
MDYHWDEDIAIVGIGLRLPGECFSANQLWEKLSNSFDGIVKVPSDRWSHSFYENGVIGTKNAGMLPLDEWKKFDPLFFGISPKDCAAIDPQERMMLTLTYEALEDAQIPLAQVRGTKTGVFVGVSNIDFRVMTERQSTIDSRPTLLNDIYSYGMIANRVSFCYDFRGPSVGLDSACSSSLFAADQACQSLLSGSSDMVVCGGINALFDPDTSAGYSCLGVINDYCRSFDADGKGFVRSEGGAAVILKRLSDAERLGNRIYAVIKSRSSNSDGHYNKHTMSTPSAASQADNIKLALARADIAASQIYYVEAHATGTVIPFGEWNIKVVTTTEDLPTDQTILMGVNSFGIGGTNCHMILQEYKKKATNQQQQQQNNILNVNYLIPISGNSLLSLDNYIGCLMDKENEYQNKLPFNEFVMNQCLSKSYHSHRKVFIASDWNDFIEQKSTVQSQLPPMAAMSNEQRSSSGKKVIYVMCGQGPQWNQMGMQLYHSDQHYKSNVDRIDSLFSKYTGYSIIGRLNDIPSESNDIHHPILAQPSLFIFQVSLVELYKKWGINPSIVLGHSFGDITACYISGLVSLEDAVKIVYYRSIYQNETIGSGRMLVVGMNENDYQSQYLNRFPTLEIACYNSPNSIVLTGNEILLDELSSLLKSNGTFNTFLRSPCSFHSHSQDTIKDKLHQSLSDIDIDGNSKITIPWYSTLTSEKQSSINSEYIFENIRKPVLFRQTLETLVRDIGNESSLANDYIFLEIAPHPTLSNLITQNIPTAKVVNPLVRNKDESIYFLASIASLHCLGVTVNFQCQFTRQQILDTQWKDRTSILPRYQWDSEMFWYETSLSKFKRLNGPSTTLLGTPSVYNGQQSYHSDIDIKRAPFRYLQDHCVKDKPLFPGAGYIDCIIEALRTNKMDINICNLQFLNPVFLNGDNRSSQHNNLQFQRMQTTIDKLYANDYQIQFFNKNGECHDDSLQWNKSAQARVSLSTPRSPKSIDLIQLSEKCDLTKMTSDELYERAARVGLNYGPAFKCIKSMLVGDKSTLATISINNNYNNNYPKNIINAIILDNCAHGLIGLLEERRQFIFKSIEDMTINYQLLEQIEQSPPTEMLLASTLTHTDAFNYSGRCSLALPNGQVLLEIGKYTISTQDRLKRKTIKYPSNELYETFLTPKESSFPEISSVQLAPLPRESFDCQAILSTTPEAIRFLCHSMMNLIPGFNLHDALNQSIEQSIVSFNIQQSRSNGLLFKRCIEMLREYRDSLTTYSISSEYLDQLHLKYPTLVNRELEVMKTAADKALSPKKQRKTIKLLEIGGGTGSLTHVLISELDRVLANQNYVQIYYTFTDVSPFFVTPMKEYYSNVSFQSKNNLHIKFKTLDLEQDCLKQRYLPGSYDMILMSFVIHVVPNIKQTLNNIQKIMAPHGWLLFIEPNYKVPLIDISFGGFSQIWSFNDDIRDHYSLRPMEWMNILSKDIGFKNTRVIGPNDSNGYQLSCESGLSYIVLSQRTAIKELDIYSYLSTPNTTTTTLIVGNKVQEYQQVLENNSFTTVKCNEIEQSTCQLLKSSNIIFLPAGEQQTYQTYQETIFQLSTLLKLFTQQPANQQPNISVITRDCKSSNFFSNSLVGIVRTALNDYQDLKITHIDISASSLGVETLNTIIQLSNNFETLGDNEYYIDCSGNIMVERAFKINKELLATSLAYETDPSLLGCNVNINLEFKLFERDAQLAPNDIEVHVQAVGLNFKDLMFYRRALPQEMITTGDVMHPPIGLELSGIVTRVGSSVSEFKVGEEVFGFCSHSMTSHIIESKDRFIHKPSSISFAEAASLPITYGTVYHSLMNICQFDPDNDTVLIHSATGGVGIAALNILRWLNCKRVYATAGSIEKIEYLKSNYSDILIDVFLSTTTEFAQLIKEKCDGVDVLLNTLSVDFMTSNFKALRPYGRIADLSLTHVYNKEIIDYGSFNGDHGYHAVNFQSICDNRTKYTNGMLRKIVEAIHSNQLELPPIQSFSALNVKQAVESMKNRTHIGKFVVDCSDLSRDILKPLIEYRSASPTPKFNFKVNLSNSILVTGQKGISLELIKFLTKHSSAKDIIVLSKSTLKYRLEKLINLSTSPKIHFYQTDVSNKEELESTMSTIIEKYPPIETVFHLAAIFEDQTLTDLTFENIKKIHDPKVLGAVNLHETTIAHNIPVKQFVVFSSISSFNGSTAQPSYNSSNLVVDSLCNFRNEQLELCSKSIRFGPLLGEGRVSDSVGIIEFFLSRGMESLPVSKFLGGLEAILSQYTYSNVIVGDIATSKIYDYHPQIRPKIEHLIEGETGTKTKVDQSRDTEDIVTSTLASLLSISPSKLSADTQLMDFGVDSLMTIQVKSFFDQQFDKELFNITSIPTMTINQIVSKIKSKQNTIPPKNTTTKNVLLNINKLQINLKV